tara:strand:+ start:143 stop:760 length:618 start_codon:yes stop_codon:yes gene_type:complete
MKKLTILFLVLTTLNLEAQTSFSEINNSHEWAWLGVDFSNTKLLGSEGFNDPEQIINYYLPNINLLVFNEADKYNVEKAFRIYNYHPYSYYFDKTNRRTSTENLFADRDYLLEESEVIDIINTYKFDKIKQDLALAFIVESLDKSLAKETIWVTVINTKTKDILLLERMIEEPGGFGFRNYWASPIARVIKKIKKKKYKIWKRTY